MIKKGSLSFFVHSSEYPHLIMPTGETYLQLLYPILDFIENLTQDVDLQQT